tara:strand:+ start:1536 stop:2474 length:939 start_codon:yes stop_codon:yes gene_type:complete
MMMKKKIRIFITKLVIFLMKFKLSLRIINYLFNKSSWKICDHFVRYIKKPNYNFYWKINLLNNKSILTRVGDNHDNSWDFAISYKWHDIGLSKIEKIIDEFYENNGLFIDIGSNMGLRSLTYLSNNKKCLLFEPNIDLHKFNEELFRINNFSNYELSNLCLSDSKRKDKMYISSSTYMSSLDKKIAKQDNIIDEREIELTTLDDYLINNKEIVYNLKVDVEGHEFAVIKGAQKTIKKHQPTLLIEILDQTENRKNICNFLYELNYNVYEIKSNNSEKFITKIYNNNFSNNCTNYLFLNNPNLIEILDKSYTN